jgi:glycosyltransferase involved in cell wall biosynthesis
MTEEIRRVIHISSRADLGGGPRHIVSLVEGLRMKKVSSYIAAPNQGYFSKIFCNESSGFFPLPLREVTLPSLLGLVSFIGENSINLIHSHGRGAGIFGRLSGLITGLPVVHTHHGLYLEKYKGFRHWFFVYLERLLNRMSSRIIFVSQSEMDACDRMGALDLPKSVIIPNGVSVSESSRPFRSKGKLELITVTRLEPEKGNTQLIDLVGRLRNFTEDFRLRIIGEGPERVLLEAKVKSMGLQERVEFLGGRNDVADLLRESDVFITCSLGEAHSIAMLEAMSHGLPILASRVRGHIDLVKQGENGLLFEINDPDEGALSVLRLMEDREYADSLGAAGRQQVIMHYSVDVMLERISNLYHDVISERRIA